MKDLQKAGGIAALINATAYIIGFGMALTILAPVMDSAPEQYLAFLADNQTLMVAWYIIIYLIAGVFMVPLALALHERLKNNAPALMQNATAFGLIWAVTIIISGMIQVHDVGVVSDLYGKDPAQAATVMLALGAVERGIGGAIELPGGIWVLLVSWAALRTGGLPKALNYLGLAIGLAGIVTIVPALGEGGSIFGLGFIVWFVWAGITMLRNSSSSTQ
ncbi:MAG: DUF4386 domain-containing protein [Anaerolineales bacterium]|nr:DUF4386 domain-containing protein [Anaerolineales bacterium]